MGERFGRMAVWDPCPGLTGLHSINPGGIKPHDKVTDGAERQLQLGSQDSTEHPFVGKPAIAFTAI